LNTVLPLAFLLNRAWLMVNSDWWVTLTNFDEKQCHKWALLLRERRAKMYKASAAIKAGDFEGAKRLLSEVVYGVSAGKHADPGMAGSLLYHMAMVTKMAVETRFLLQEFTTNAPHIDVQVWRFYSDFASDVRELSKELLTANVNPKTIVTEPLGVNKKSLFSAS
jgi:hypothetical protein